jgi:glycine oxidase
VDARWVEGAEAVRLEPALARPEGALLLETQGYVRVGQLLAALGAAAQRHGATILEHRKVTGIAPRPEGVVVTAAGETHTCTTAIVAAGSWSAQVAAGPGITPIRGQLLELRWKGPPVTRVLWSDLCYVVPWEDGTVLVGATVESAGFDQRTTLSGVRGLADAACRLMPSAQDATFVQARAGLRPSTSDGVPLMGRSAQHPGIVYATGHYRNGVLLAPLTADLIADLVMDNREDPVLALTAPGR